MGDLVAILDEITQFLSTNQKPTLKNPVDDRDEPEDLLEVIDDYESAKTFFSNISKKLKIALQENDSQALISIFGTGFEFEQIKDISRPIVSTPRAIEPTRAYGTYYGTRKQS